MRSGLFLLALFFQLITAAQGRQLVMAEYFVDIDPGAGLATSMTAADGSFDQALEQVLNTAVAEATPGHHLVGVRLKVQDGAWSNTFRTIFYQNELQPARSLRVNLAEAFIDNDPGAGNATPMLAFDGNFDQSLEGALIAGIPLDPGPHLVGVRVRDASGTWSNTFRTVVLHNGLISPRVPSVQLAEIYLDQDPGAGSATPMLAFDGSLDGALETVFANGLVLSFGHHVLGVRVLGGDGVWSNTFRSVIYQDGNNGARAPHIEQAEYYLGSDPGPGNASTLIAQDNGFDEALEAALGSSATPISGPAVIGVRFKGADGSWSNTFRSVVVVQQTASVQVSVEDELTYLNNDAPLVAGAHVVISDTSTSAVYADGFSDATGVFFASGLPSGTHHITVSEPIHFTHNGTISLIAGYTLNARIFIGRAPDGDNDGYTANNDCNDTDATIHPGAPEVCDDGIDNDCDGSVDEAIAYYADGDGDGSGDPAADSLSCAPPGGYVTDNTDQCPNDPNKTEPGTCGCGIPDSDTDGDGTADCIDTCPSAPGEVSSPCDDGDPCTINDQLNNSCTCSGTFADSDGDGTCDASDCAPNDPAVHPGAVEICDGIDDNCNGLVDDVSQTFTLHSGNGIIGQSDAAVRMLVGPNDESFPAVFTPADFLAARNGPAPIITLHNPAWVPSLAADASAKWVNNLGNNGDGASGLYAINFNVNGAVVSAQIIFHYAVDNFLGGGPNQGVYLNGQLLSGNTSGGDYSGQYTFSRSDIGPLLLPGLNTLYVNASDVGGPGAVIFSATITVTATCEMSFWYADSDGDGHGDPAEMLPSFTQPNGYVADSTDCNDANAAINPGAPEVCDGVDNDCNGSVDDLIMSGLSLYLPFTGNADDLSGNGHNGALFNTSPVSGHTGAANAAFAFNGSSARIEVADHPDLRPASFTLSTWIYYDAVPGGVQCIVNKPLCGGYSDSYGIWFEGGMLRAGWGYGPNTIDYRGYAAPAAGAWHHVALSLDDITNSASVYVDNMLMGTYPVTQSIAYDNTPLVIGAEYENCALGFYFNGRVDETALFDRALNATEISQLFNGGPIGYPQEVCDGMDNNCNGQIDDGVGAFYYTDADGDGYGDPASAIQACTQPPNTVALGGDCAPNDAVVNPGAQEVCDGVDNNCDGAIDEQVVLRFDGSDDHVAVGSWFTEQNFTIELWLKPGATQNQYANIVDNNHAFNVRWVCQQDGSITNQYYWSVASAGSPSVTFTLEPDQWQHLSLVKAPGQIAVYVNGVLIGTSACTGGIIGVGGGDLVRIGQWGGGGRAWHGSMHDVRFWNSDLTQAQIATVIQQTIVSPTPGLLANYRMNDGAPNGNNTGLTSVADASGNAHHGPLIGFSLNGTNSNFIGTGIDVDNDSIADCNDGCPLDPLKTSPGICGCGTPDTDTDGDGTADCIDGCPNDPFKTNAGICGCGVADVDLDNDGTADCNDACPNDPLKIIAGICGCGTPDTDGDGDGTADCNDACPNDPLKTLPGGCGCGVTDVPAQWYADNDADGFGDGANSIPGLTCLQPSGYVGNSIDCDDNNAAINSMAYDACPDGIDNNCNGLVDEQSGMVGQPCSSTIGACQPGVWGCVANVLTCVGGTLPSAEICSDGIDNDCDGQVDEITPETVPLTWYVDFDSDGYGSPDPLSIIHSCAPQPGYALNNNDCNDNNSAVNPGATELCNGLDDNCDGNVESGPIVPWYADVDGDGFGDADVEVLTCIQPIGFVSVAGDCDDQDPGIHPGAPEVCNGLDDDCDGAIDGLDPGAVLTTWYLDADGDGSGSPADTVIACAPPIGYVAQGADCEDNDPSINPMANDACPDGIDNNCNGLVDEQATMIGQPCGSSVGQCVMGTWGCANNVLTCIGGVAATAEICSDGLDNDCDGQVDETSPETVPLTWYVDADGDGFGNPDTSLIVLSCDPQPGYAISAGDCNDQAPNIDPAQPEVCNGFDDNCNGLVDEGIPAHFADADGDGLGDPAQPVPCTTPGAVMNDSDCNDNDPVPCGTVVLPQLVERRVIGSTGSATQVGTVRVEWTLGEPIVTTVEDQGLRLTQGFHQSPSLKLRLNLRALLQGPFVSPSYGMIDSLRTRGLIPLEEPYTALGYVHVGGGGETTTAGVLTTAGPDAVVDWIVVELRATSTPDVVMASRAGLLQRDGDIVDVDGTSPLAFKAPSADYQVAVIHRNHLPVITATPTSVSTTPAVIDLTDGSTLLYGVQPVRVDGALHMLWCGDVNGDGTIRYTGALNDRDPILVRIGGIIPTNTQSGYASEDVNMDGTIKYTGTNNDRDPILQNIGGTVPTNVRNAQMP